MTGANGALRGFFRAPPELQSFAQFSFVLPEYRSSTAHDLRRVPTPRATLYFAVDVREHVSGSKIGTGLFCEGPHSRGFEVRCDCDEMVAVKVKSGALGALLGIPARELRDQTINLEQVWGRSAALLAEQMQEASSAEERLRLLQRELSQRYLARERENGLALGVANAIERRAGKVRIADLSDNAGVGRRALLQRFDSCVAPHLAVLLENAAYTATLALFLLAESDADREEALHELGIAGDDVDAIRAAIGAVSAEEKSRQRRWFSAIVAALSGVDELPSGELDHLDEALARAGLPTDIAGRIIERGGGQAVRGDVSPDGPLSLLVECGVDLRELDKRLRMADDLDGLTIDVARRRLSDWTRHNRRRVAALVAQRRPPDEAKTLPDSWTAPHTLRFELDPAPAEWLRPVTDSLRALGLDPQADGLADDAVMELIRMAGLSTAAEFEALVEQLYDREEQERILRASAAGWRSELILLGTLARTRQGDSRAAIRAQATTVEELLPLAPTAPAALRPSLDELLTAHRALASALSERITDALSATPERASILALANEHGLATSHLQAVERALQGPRRELARKLRAQMTQLAARSLRPHVPAELQGAPAPEPDKARDRRKVAAVKVNPTTDARRRHLGDEGERWALAAVLGPIVALEPPKRRVAIKEIVALLEKFNGMPIDKAKAHAEPACEPQLDEEELIDELTELLHVSRHSDGFGFDLLGWLPPDPRSEPIALCLEVKSTSNGTFHLSRGEWERAEWFRTQGDGEKYAILVVQRASGSGPPKRLDLLPDPLHLVETGQLTKRDDGYELVYRAA